MHFHAPQSIPVPPYDLINVFPYTLGYIRTPQATIWSRSWNLDLPGYNQRCLPMPHNQSLFPLMAFKMYSDIHIFGHILKYTYLVILRQLRLLYCPDSRVWIHRIPFWMPSHAHQSINVSPATWLMCFHPYPAILEHIRPLSSLYDPDPLFRITRIAIWIIDNL